MADNAAFIDRRVEAAILAVFVLQPLRATEDAAEISDILSEHDDIGIAFEFLIEAFAEGFTVGEYA